MINAKWMRQSVTFVLLTVVITGSASASVTLKVTEANQVRQETFESLATAVSAARSARQKTPTAQLEVTLHEGIYHLDAPVYLDATLSGTPQAPTVIRGAPGRWPELRASRIVKTSWSPYDKGIWVAEVTGDDFDQLWVNGQRQVLARYPNYDPTIRPLGGYASDAVARERTDRWRHPEDAIIRAIHFSRWGGITIAVKGRNNDGSLILSPPVGNNRVSPPQDQPNDPYRFVEGVFEELDTAGEWFFDKRTRQLFFKPATGIDLSQAQIEVSTASELLNITGARDTPVHDILIEGIDFSHARDTSLEATEPLLRSDWKITRQAAVFVTNGENIKIKDSNFHDLGGQGVFVSGYARNVAITGNAFWDMGGTAISFVGLPGAVRSPRFEYADSLPLDEIDRTPGPLTSDYPAQSNAEDNLIHDIGRIDKQAAGINIDMAMDIRLAFNSIYQVPRAGINIGDGTWGGHILEHNDVFDTVLESGDHGAFNAWGRDRFWRADRQAMNAAVASDPILPTLDAIKPIIMRYNRFRSDHGWDIDLDDGASNYEIYGNLMLAGGLKLREGFRRKVHGNIMLNNSLHPHVWFKNSEDSFAHNIVMTAYQPILIDSWPAEIDHNLFPDAEALQAAQALGLDAHSTAGDPQFIDPKTGDYRVGPASPALKIGFENPPMDFGVRSERLRRIARTPSYPMPLQWMASQKDITTDLFGATVKSVETLGEQSAAGLPDISGVLVLSVKPGSAAERSGLLAGDVILNIIDHADGTLSDTASPVKDLVSLIRLIKSLDWKDRVVMQIQRQQAPKTLFLIK